MRFFNKNLSKFYPSISKINILIDYANSLSSEKAIAFKQRMAAIDKHQIESVVETCDYHKNDIEYSLLQISSIVDDLNIDDKASAYLKRELSKLWDRFEGLEDDMCKDLVHSGKMSAMKHMFLLKLDLVNLECNCLLNHILENPDEYNLTDFNDVAGIHNSIEALTDRVLSVSNMTNYNQEVLCYQFDNDVFTPKYNDIKENLSSYQNKEAAWLGWDWDCDWERSSFSG